jgi:hypothetical protein
MKSLSAIGISKTGETVKTDFAMVFTVSATGDAVNNKPLFLVQKPALFYLHLFISR